MRTNPRQPDRGHAGVGREDGVIAGDIIDDGGHQLRTDGAARILDDRANLGQEAPGHRPCVAVGVDEGALLGEPAAIPAPCGLEVVGVGLGGDPIYQRGDRDAGVGDDPEIDGRATADVAAVAVDLDRRHRWEPLGVGEVRPQHQKQLGAIEGDLARGVADEAALPDLEAVVVFEALLRLQGEDDRRRQPLG